MNVGAAGVGALLVAGRLLVNHNVNRGWWGYSASEWLINYGGGFLRRGLGGEIILRTPAPSDLVALEMWIMVLSITTLVLLAVLIQRSMRSTGTAWVLLVWLLPSGALIGPLQSIWQPFWVKSTQFAMRKEELLLLIVCLAAVWWGADGPRTRQRFLLSAVVMGLFLLLAALIHEGLTIPATASVALLAWRATQTAYRSQRWVAMGMIVLPAAVGVGLAVTHPGHSADPAAIWSAVDAPTRTWYESGTTPQFTPMVADVPLAIANLRDDLSGATRSVIGFYLASGTVVWWAICAVVVLGAAALVLAFADRSKSGTRALAVSALITVGSTTPLFLVGYDWGRWIAMGANLMVIVGLASIARSPEPDSFPLRWGTALIMALALTAAWAIGIQEVGDPRGLLWYGIDGGLPEPPEVRSD